MIELGLAGVSFVSKDNNSNNNNNDENENGAPLELRGHLQELVATYDNMTGAISFGVKRFVPDGFSPQRQFWFPGVFQNVRRVMDEDTRFYVAMKTPQGRAVRISYLGGIPLWATNQWTDDLSLLRNSAQGRFDFTLRRLARFQILLAKASSVCQAIAVEQLDQSPAQYGYEIYYPSMAIETQKLRNQDIHNINRNAAINDPLRLIEQCQMRPNMVAHRFTIRRRDFQNMFPSKIWVSNGSKNFLRSLSFHSAEYPHDDIDKDHETEQRERNLIVSESLTNIAVPPPPLPMSSDVDMPNASSSSYSPSP